MSVAPPPWWVERERAFGDFLRRPLLVEGGRLRADVAGAGALLRAMIVDDESGVVAGAAARLALHHEQYWMRLFVVVQEHVPRICRVMGPFALNALTMAALSEPRQPATLDDVGAVVADAIRAGLDGFVVGVASALRSDGHVVATPLPRLATHPSPTRNGVAIRAVRTVLAGVDVPWSMLSQALTLDLAHHRTFDATLSPLWQPSDDEIAAVRAGHAVVRSAPSMSILRLDWAVDDRGAGGAGAALANAGAAMTEAHSHGQRHRQTLPARLPTPTHRVVWRVDDGVAAADVDVVTARLLARFAREGYAEVVAHVAARFPPGAADWLDRTFDTFARAAAARGWWIGTRQPQTGLPTP